MIQSIKLFLRTVRVLYGLIKKENSPLKQTHFSNEVYPGLNNEPTPMNVFKPENPNKYTIIIFPGASPTAEEHPQMIWLSHVMRKAGYQVFLPQIPPLKNLIISQSISDWMEHVYVWIRNHKDVNAEKIIMIGISFGGAMVLMASLKKEIQRHPPKSVLVYGTYYDIETTLKFLMTGKLLINGQEKGVKVNEWGLIVFFHNYLSRIEIGYDISSVKKILKLSVQEKNEKVEEVLNKISGKEKELITQILAGRVNEEIMRITSLIWEECRGEFEIISPKYWCDKISQKVFIMHGANDTMSPYTESLQLAEKLPNCRLLISYLYEHHNLQSTKGIFFKLKEFIKIFSFLFEFIQYTERKQSFKN